MLTSICQCGATESGNDRSQPIESSSKWPGVEYLGAGPPPFWSAFELALATKEEGADPEQRGGRHVHEEEEQARPVR